MNADQMSLDSLLKDNAVKIAIAKDRIEAMSSDPLEYKLSLVDKRSELKNKGYQAFIDESKIPKDKYERIQNAIDKRLDNLPWSVDEAIRRKKFALDSLEEERDILLDKQKDVRYLNYLHGKPIDLHDYPRIVRHK